MLLQHTRRVPLRYTGCAGDQVRVRTRGLEDPRVALAVALSEGLHHAVDLLSVTWQPEAPKELSVRGANTHSQRRRHRYAQRDTERQTRREVTAETQRDCQWVSNRGRRQVRMSSYTAITLRLI